MRVSIRAGIAGGRRTHLGNSETPGSTWFRGVVLTGSLVSERNLISFVLQLKRPFSVTSSFFFPSHTVKNFSGQTFFSTKNKLMTALSTTV